MQRLVRLSYHDRISAAVPEAFHPMLPPRPAVEALPTAGAADAANGSAALEELQATAAAELVQMVRSFVNAPGHLTLCAHRSTPGCHAQMKLQASRTCNAWLP